jgi:hypothetical protein
MNTTSGVWKDYLAPRTALEIIAAEKREQAAKTARLREARLAREAAEAQQQGAARAA